MLLLNGTGETRDGAPGPSTSNDDINFTGGGL